MKHISKQRTIKAATQQMSDVATGDTVIVHIRGKEIPCVVRLCNYTFCMHCVLLHEDCTQFRGTVKGCEIEQRKAFVPVEETVE